MLETTMEFFMSSYADAVQTLPGELQTHITAYLQSDLQHQHLLTSCKRYMDELHRTADVGNHKRLLNQFVISLLAIQEICDRRTTTLDEMDQLVEHHMQKLTTARANLITERPHSCASGTENTVESELDADDQTESESRNSTTQSVHPRDTHSEASVKKSNYEDSEAEAHGGAQLNFKRKVRSPLRSTAQLTRPVGSRRVLSRWDSGASRRRTAASTLTGSKKTAIQALRQRCINEQRTRDRTMTESQRHKLGGTYSRYATVQHSQQHELPQQQQRLKSQRVLPRSLHTSKNRSVHLFDSSRRRSTNTSKEGKNRSTYLTSGRPLNSKLTRASGLRLSSRTEWSSSDQYYFNDGSADANTRSASHVSSEDEREEATGAPVMASHHSSRSVDLASWSKENGEDMEVSEELDDSDYADDDDANEGASLSMREIKPYCGKDPKSRLSSPPSTITGSSSSFSRNVRLGVNRRRVSRLRKLADPNSGYVRAPERISSGAAQASPSSSLDMSSVQPRGNLSASVHSLNSTMTKRREKSAYGTAARHQRPDLKQTARIALDETVKSTSDTPQKPRHLGSSTEQSSDGSISPDERLYCICRKISFGEMIACDNELCSVEWFHFACVDIRTQPKGKWYCPFCRGDSSKVKRPDV